MPASQLRSFFQTQPLYFQRTYLTVNSIQYLSVFVNIDPLRGFQKSWMKEIISSLVYKNLINTTQNPTIILIKIYGTIAIRIIARIERTIESLLFLFIVLDLINTYIPINKEPNANIVPMSNSNLNNSPPRAKNINGVRDITRPNGVSHVV